MTREEIQRIAVEAANKLAAELGVPVGGDISKLISLCECAATISFAFSILNRPTLDAETAAPIQSAYDAGSPVILGLIGDAGK